MTQADKKIQALYDKYAKFPLYLYIDAIFGRTTEDSIYRREAVKYLKLAPGAIVLDVACGIGFNFKIIEQYLQNKGKLIGIDVWILLYSWHK